MSDGVNGRATELSAIVGQYRAGAITRDQFWGLMRDRHRLLEQYRALIQGTDIATIEIHPGELRVRTSAGRLLAWNVEDIRSAPSELVNSGTYERDDANRLLRAAQNARVVFDIGANAGYYALHFVSHLAPGGTVHAFEPVPATYERLVHNINLNGLQRVVLAHNFGFGEQAGTATFFVPNWSGSSAASLKNLHPEEANDQVAARLTTLDAYFPTTGLNQLDLVKLDVEGAEFAVLRGGMGTLAHHKPLLFVELLRKWSAPFGYSPNDVIDLLAGIGYRCYVAADGKVVPIERITETTKQTNFFFVHVDAAHEWLVQNARA